MIILAIDPSSNFHETSTTGIILLNNEAEVNHWLVGFGRENFKTWYEEVGKFLEYDVVVTEKFTVRENDRARDNTPIQTIEMIQKCFPETELISNNEYKTTVPDELLKLLDLWLFPENGNHNDLRASARIGLHWAIMTEQREVINAIGRRCIPNQV